MCVSLALNAATGRSGVAARGGTEARARSRSSSMVGGRDAGASGSWGRHHATIVVQVRQRVRCCRTISRVAVPQCLPEPPRLAICCVVDSEEAEWLRFGPCSDEETHHSRAHVLTNTRLNGFPRRPRDYRSLILAPYFRCALPPPHDYTCT